MELDNLANGLIVDKDCCSHVQLVVDQVAQFLRLILLHLHQDLFHQSQKRYYMTCSIKVRRDTICIFQNAIFVCLSAKRRHL